MGLNCDVAPVQQAVVRRRLRHVDNPLRCKGFVISPTRVVQPSARLGGPAPAASRHNVAKALNGGAEFAVGITYMNGVRGTAPLPGARRM
jgi:hypothetical protein